MANNGAGERKSRARTVLAVTFAVLLAALAVEFLVPDARLAGGASDPSADSARVAREIEQIAPQADPNLFVLVSSPTGITDARVAAAGRALTERLGQIDGVTGVNSAWSVPLAALRSTDQKSGLVIAHIEGDEGAQDRVLADLRSRLPAADADIDVRLGGPVAVRAEVQSTIKSDLIKAELIALPLMFVVLLVVFGGLAAALLPIAVGVFSIVSTNALLKILSQVADVSVFSQNLTTAVGLGLAVDYALLMVRRFREESAAHGDVAAATRATVASAGRTVLFSGATITAVLAVLLMFPMYFLRSFAYAGIIVVAISMLAVLVCLPAAFELLGGRLTAPRSAPSRPERGYWAAWTRWVLRRPRLLTLATTAVLICLALPFGAVAYGTVDDRQLPPGAAIRTTHDMLRTDFEAGALPIANLVVPAHADPSDIGALAQELEQVDGVAAVSPPPLLTDPRTAALPTPATLLVTVKKGIEPTSTRGQAVVSEVQRLARDHGVLVGGEIATLLDTKAAIGRVAPLAITLVVIVALLAVFLLTGSVVLAAVSVLVNGLSLTATLGAIVWIFQDGHLSGLLGFTPTGAIDTTLPILVVCIAFGLSMDYGVFVLARLTEERQAGVPHREAIVNAIQRTGGIITSAAVILTIVLAAIGTSQVAATKMIGTGVALAALVDASIVRLVLVPASLATLGSMTWWSPRLLNRLSARFSSAERAAPAPPVPAPTARDLGR
ncbi:MMPL family transporter [Nocardia wallacei]|uniref:MMPL family transporter n=1 Tax=Nocardia wallacei TaxID=480035 RepID=UPI0024538259|nr:MMPL family transporter [Nocardia wallacei]